MKTSSKRYWQIDTARGIAVILMISYHTLYDLDFLQIVSLPLRSMSVRLMLYPIGILFLSLVGFSLVLSYKRYLNDKKSVPPFRKYGKRGLFLFSLALIITAVTWVYPHDGFIVFGVLHCISLSIIFSYWFITRPTLALISGIALIFLGILFYQITVSTPYLFWIGLKTSSFYTLDYFPLIPWFGVVLIGIFFGQKTYTILQKKYNVSEKPPKVAIPFTFLGKHALVIYFIHQPIVFGLIILLFGTL